MQRMTVSPSSSTTRRSTPWVAGCCGPRLTSMCSSPRPGLSGSPAAVSGTRVGLPWASTPGVASSSSRVRLLTIGARVGDDAALAALQPVAHVLGQVAAGIRDRQLLERVVRLGVGIQRLPHLLGAREAAAQREAFAERIPFGVGLPHQNAAQIGMSFGCPPEHAEHFALEPIGAAPQTPHGIDRQLVGRVELDLDANVGFARERAKKVDDLERAFAVAVLDGGHVYEIVKFLAGRVLEPAHRVEQAIARDVDDGFAVACRRFPHGPGKGNHDERNWCTELRTGSELSSIVWGG